MAEFKYEGLDQQGKAQAGSVNAATQDAAIVMLQRKGLTLTSITGGGEKSLLQQMQGITFFNSVSSRDLVLLSRQIATLFEAQVSALRVFRLLAEQAEKPYVRQVLAEISDDLQGGNAISKALEKHPKVFSDFYVNMVRSGEESGKLDQTFLYLADYIDRSYELTSKARNALIYPAFIMITFVGVMSLMLTVVIPKIGAILIDSGQELPIYTSIILGFSNFLVDYGIFLVIALIVGGYFLYRYVQTDSGKIAASHFKFAIPYVGALYQKLYLSRIADNMNVMLTSGISAVRSLEITANVVEDDVYEAILKESIEAVKGGSPLSQTLARHPEAIPGIFVQMLQIGEETGEMGHILERLAKFYNREVNAAVDTLVSLIEPILIVALALGVGFLRALGGHRHHRHFGLHRSCVAQQRPLPRCRRRHSGQHEHDPHAVRGGRKRQQRQLCKRLHRLNGSKRPQLCTLLGRSRCYSRHRNRHRRYRSNGHLPQQRFRLGGGISAQVYRHGLPLRRLHRQGCHLDQQHRRKRHHLPVVFLLGRDAQNPAPGGVFCCYILKPCKRQRAGLPLWSSSWSSLLSGYSLRLS